jgi:hypothetical protein
MNTTYSHGGSSLAPPSSSHCSHLNQIKQHTGRDGAKPSQQEGQSTQKLSTGKRAVPAKGVPAKPAGKAASAPAVAVAVGKPIGKAGPSKMSSIQSQLVSSLSVLSAFYSPAQKAAAAKKQQEQGTFPRVVKPATFPSLRFPSTHDCIHLSASAGF